MINQVLTSKAQIWIIKYWKGIKLNSLRTPRDILSKVRFWQGLISAKVVLLCEKKLRSYTRTWQNVNDKKNHFWHDLRCMARFLNVVFTPQRQWLPWSIISHVKDTGAKMTNIYYQKTDDGVKQSEKPTFLGYLFEIGIRVHEELTQGEWHVDILQPLPYLWEAHLWYRLGHIHQSSLVLCRAAIMIRI